MILSFDELHLCQVDTFCFVIIFINVVVGTLLVVPIEIVGNKKCNFIN